MCWLEGGIASASLKSSMHVVRKAGPRHGWQHFTSFHFFSPAPNSVPQVVQAGSCWQKMDRHAEQTNLHEDLGKHGCATSTATQRQLNGNGNSTATATQRQRQLNNNSTATQWHLNVNGNSTTTQRQLNGNSMATQRQQQVTTGQLTPNQSVACGRSRTPGSRRWRCPAGAGSGGYARRRQTQTVGGNGMQLNNQ